MSKYIIKHTSIFKKQLKLAKKRNKNLDKLSIVVNLLSE